MKIFLALAPLAALILFSLWVQIPFAQASITRQLPPARIARVPEATADVAIVDFAFQPVTITINIKDAVQWTHNGGMLTPHTTTSDTGLWNSGTLSLGQKFSHTFTSTGYFPYHCDFHPLQMKGVVRVIAPIFIPLLTNIF